MLPFNWDALGCLGSAWARLLGRSCWSLLGLKLVSCDFVINFVGESTFVISSGRPSSMNMWCPHDIGRESWVWEEQQAL